ncbi:hypothetical protein [Herbaspirillum sp. NPDC087042]|uniref:hypothetical protein n=1 Tax=Herbaspirillum sp. NPDC087042 TaxID=3364004 RepID=UPI0037F6C9E7
MRKARRFFGVCNAAEVVLAGAACKAAGILLAYNNAAPACRKLRRGMALESPIFSPDEVVLAAPMDSVLLVRTFYRLVLLSCAGKLILSLIFFCNYVILGDYL